MSCFVEALIACVLVLACVLTVSLAVSRFAGLLETASASLPRRRRLRRTFVFITVFILTAAIVGFVASEVKDVERFYKRGGSWGKFAVAVAGFIIIPGLLAGAARALFDHALSARYKFTVPRKTVLVDPDNRRAFQAGRTYWAAIKKPKSVDLDEATESVESELNGAGIVRWIPDADNIFPFIALGHDGVRHKVQQIFRAEDFPDLAEYQSSLGVIFTKNSVQRPAPEIVDIRGGIDQMEVKAEQLAEIERAWTKMDALLADSPMRLRQRVKQTYDDMIAKVMGVR